MPKRWTAEERRRRNPRKACKGWPEFCGFCPCEAPPCPEGHEWHCQVCPAACIPEATWCACCNEKARAARGWVEAFEVWQELRARKMRAVLSLRKKARAAARKAPRGMVDTSVYAHLGISDAD